MTSAARDLRTASPQAVRDHGDDRFPLAPVVLLLGGLAYATFAQGGFHPNQLRVLALVLISAAGTTMWRQPLALRELVRPPVAAVLAVAAWSVVAAAVAGNLGGSAQPLELFAALVAVLITVPRLDLGQRALVGSGVLAVGAVVAVTGWVGVVARLQPWALVDGGLWRAASTVTYANAAAALLTITALVAIAREVADPAPRWRLSAYLSMLTMAATMSRAGILSFALGVAVLAVVMGPRRTARAAWPVFIGAAIGALALVPSMPVGSQPQPVLAILGAIAGAAVCVYGVRVRVTRVHVAVALMVLGAGLVLVVAHLSTSAEGIGGRATLQSPDRSNEWRSAADIIQAHPVTGVGPTDAVFSWFDSDGTLRAVKYSHDEYLQIAATLGLAGLIIACGGFVSTFVWLISRISRFTPRERWVGGCTVSAAVASAAEGLFDFAWHIPLIPVLGAVLLGFLVPSAPSTIRSLRPLERQAQCDTNDY